MSKETLYKEFIAFHPGSYVEDIIDDLNITQGEFAERLGTSSKTISKIVNGEENISKDIANKLAKLTGISIKTWLNLQANYDAKIMEIEDLQIEDEKKVVDLIDFSYFKKNNFVQDKRYTSNEKIAELRKILTISNLAKLYEFNTAVSYRHKKEFSEKSIVNSNVMLEIAINASRNETDNKFNKKKLENSLPRIRAMSLARPEDFYGELVDLLLDCGVVLVALPTLKNADLNGATKKFKNGSVLLLITDRNKNADIFWFSLMHEIGHICNNDFYSNYEDEDAYREKERRADCFALDFYIPQNEYNEFVRQNKFNEKSILDFSKKLGICPSILIGRLQNDKLIRYTEFHYLKKNYSIILTN